MTATSSVSLQSDKYVNGILTGTKWAVTTLTFSFPASGSYYGSGYAEASNNFQAFNLDQKAAVRSIYGSYSSVAKIKFQETTETSSNHATLRFAETDKYTTGFGYYPHTSASGGDAWFGNSSNYFNQPAKGNFAWFTMMHEIGHTLGLKHPHEAMGLFGKMPSDRDSIEYTVMSYRSYVGASASYTNGSWSYPQTLMMYDIAALQTLYGANYNTNNGNTTYQWDPNTGAAFVNGVSQGSPGSNLIFMTLWDGGGNDTYDFSNYTTNLSVDLQPGEWTTLSHAQLANVGNGHDADGNIANALLYKGNPASLIENAIGGSGNDIIKGNSAGNDLRGGVGDDRLDGRAGADRMFGGTGNDTYVVDNSGDVVNETGGDGADSVLSYISFSLADSAHVIGGVENLTLLGSAAINATGNGLDNVLTGNGAGNVLVGGAGADTLDGGGGVDVASYLTSGSGVSVSLALGLGLGGDAQGDRLFSIENLTGSNLDDTLEGNAGNNVLMGGSGIDTVSYANATSGANGQGVKVDLALKSAQNTVTAGIDTLRSFENLTGSQFNDTFRGSSGNNVLTGLGGDDWLDGKAGADTMFGGVGSDTYVVDNAGDVVNETGGDGSKDRILSYISFSLADPAHVIGAVEDLTLLGTAAINATGNDLDNTLRGNSGANVLIGGAGGDMLHGYAGADRMFGGTGNDTYVVDNSGDVVNETGGDGADSVLSYISFSLADSAHVIGGVENLTLLGSAAINATGNGLDNVLTGNGAGNVLVGGAGADTLDGGGGVDVASYLTSGSGVSVSLALGLGLGGDAQGDRLFSIENLTGSNLADTLEGNAGNNVLMGGSGIDTVSYANATSGANGQGVKVDLSLKSAQNTVTAGIDTLRSFENLTGSQFNDTFRGSSGNNVLTGLGGGDWLDGKAGADTMFGGVGSDTYVVDNAGDVVNETGGDGSKDRILSYISFSLADPAHVIGAVEDLTLLGTAAINATGNDLDNTLRGNSGANVLIGGAGGDMLHGYAGADRMFGGTGNDTYVVDNSGDVVNETGGDGADSVLSYISFSLADSAHVIGGVENLTLLGSAAINATGNGLDNVLTGNGAGNVLVGGAGADTLDGGGGVDVASYLTSGSGVSVSLALGLGLGGDAQGDRLFSIENLTGSNLDDTLEGNAGNNVLMGGSGIDTVSYANATSGANGQGVKVDLALKSAQNTVTAGIDTLRSFENLTGSQFNDSLVGTSGNNVLTGLAGNDRLTGAGGNDTFRFNANFGHDTITDFAAGPDGVAHDLITFDHTIFADFDAVMAVTAQVGSSSVITLDIDNTLTLANVNMSSLHRDDFSFA